MSRPFRVGCCAELHEPNWRWVSDALALSDVEWTFFSTAPQTALERTIRKPRLSRYRACRQLAAGAKHHDFDLIVTHHPLVTCWTELFCRRRRKCPHVAFAFNFTHLPTGIRRSVMRRAFAGVDRLIVFSNFERELYSRYFGIPVSRFEMIHWGVREPEIPDRGQGTIPRANAGTDFICAVGSQGRDYATLLEAMRRLPWIPLTVVATARSFAEVTASSNVTANVTVRLDIPRPEAEAVIQRSRFMVLPLLHAEVPCGHVTMVTGMFAGRAIVATESAGISDYLMPERNGLIVPPGDAAALASAIERLWNDPGTASRLGQNGREFALANCSEERTTAYARQLIERLQAGGEP
jgi:glycosyltransferase involved in cell wall biosynthesis